MVFNTFVELNEQKKNKKTFFDSHGWNAACSAVQSIHINPESVYPTALSYWNQTQNDAQTSRAVLFMERSQSQMTALPQPAAAAVPSHIGHRWTEIWSVEKVSSETRNSWLQLWHIFAAASLTHTHAALLSSLSPLWVLSSSGLSSFCALAFVCEAQFFFF